MNPTDVITQLRREWQRAGRAPAAAAALDAVRAHHPDLVLGTATNLYDALLALESSSTLSALQRADIVNALLEEAGDPLVRRALLQTLIPGVVSVCRQLRFGQGVIDPTETVGIALGFLSEILAEWAGQRRSYAGPDLLSALRGRLRRWLLKEKGLVSQASVFDVLDVTAPATSRLEARLASFRGQPEERLARLTYARVFEGRSLRDVARADHSNPTTLQGELRAFARRRLL